MTEKIIELLAKIDYLESRIKTLEAACEMQKDLAEKWKKKFYDLRKNDI